MSRASATRRASAASPALQHPCLWLSAATMGSVPFPVEQAISSLAPERMNRPMTSYPASRRRTADTELSTPPLIARTTRVDIEIGLCRHFDSSNCSKFSDARSNARAPHLVGAGRGDLAALDETQCQHRLDKFAGDGAGGVPSRTGVFKHHDEGNLRFISGNVTREPGVIGLASTGFRGPRLAGDSDFVQPHCLVPRPLAVGDNMAQPEPYPLQCLRRQSGNRRRVGSFYVSPGPSTRSDQRGA